MRRTGGGGLGFVMVLLVMAVIAFLTLRNWKAVAPEVKELREHNARDAARRDVQPEKFSPDAGAASTSASDDSWNPAPPARPSLGTMEQRTTTQTDATKDALQQAN